MTTVQTESIQSFGAQLITRHTSLAVQALIDDGMLNADKFDLASDVVKRAFTSAEAEVISLIQEQISHLVTAAPSKSSKKRKSSKPRKRTPYNMFVKSNTAQIREDLGEDAKVRGAVMKEAGRRWKELDADGRAPYVAQAAELNTKLASEQPVVPAATPVIPSSVYDDLVGPFPGTYAMGVFKGTKSFKTLDEAVVAMRANHNAAAIVQSKNGNRFRLRAGHKDKRNKPNKDRDGKPTPLFVYNDNTTENTWLRKSALAHYDAYGPFTKDKPFCANKQIDSHLGSDTAPVASPVITSTESDNVEEPVASPVITPTESDESDDESYESDEEDQCNLVLIRNSDDTDWVYCFEDTGHILSWVKGRAPLPEHYTGTKVNFSGKIKSGACYKDIVDGGPLPGVYVELLNDE